MLIEQLGKEAMIYMKQRYSRFVMLVIKELYYKELFLVKMNDL